MASYKTRKKVQTRHKSAGSAERHVADGPVEVGAKVYKQVVGKRAGDRVYFEVKRPNGDQVAYGVPSSALDVVFTPTGTIEVVMVDAPSGTADMKADNDGARFDMNPMQWVKAKISDIAHSDRLPEKG